MVGSVYIGLWLRNNDYFVGIISVSARTNSWINRVFQSFRLGDISFLVFSITKVIVHHIFGA